jgi:8-oxo-dGTP pyrophosphatase MutT (NUDIX family)
MKELPDRPPIRHPERVKESVEDFRINLKHFAITFYNGANEEVPSDGHIFSVEFPKYQDVVDLVPYVQEEGQSPRMVLTRSFRPIVAERQKHGADSSELNAPKDTSHMWEIFGGYIRPEEGEAGMDVSTAHILERKFPTAKVEGELETLGGCYFPSVGTATELVYPRAQRISEPSSLPENIELKTPQEIIDGYLAGTYFSTRLVELAFRFARSTHTPLTRPDTPFGPFESVDPSSFQDRQITLTEARALVSNLDTNNASITHIEAKQVAASTKPFLKSIVSEVTLPDGTNASFDFVMREGMDSVDVGCFVPVGDKIFIPIKCGVRPTLAVRNLEPHPIHTDTSPLFIEGVAGSLKGTERTLADVEAVAKDEIREEIGIEPTTLIPIGYDYPSPGHNLERTYRYLAPVDPAREVHKDQSVDETVGQWYVELNDLLQLVDEGVIRDPRLSLNARLIAHLSGYSERERPAAPREVERKYDSIINHGSDIQAWLSESARDVDNKLSRSVYYRRLKSYCENELGIVALPLTHPDEAGFFSAMVPVFAIPEHTDAQKMPFNFLHDLFHYATWGFVPLKGITENGEIEMHSFEDYFEAIGGNECHAVWYSDVIMPEEFGIAEAESIFSGDSVASAFLALDMDEEQAREAIRTIELRGEIPKEMLDHPNFERYRDVFIDRLLKYHVLDHENTKGVYEYWEQHPFVLKTAARFCNAFTDLAQYEHHYLSTLDDIRAYTEGLNPLRAHLSRTANVRIRLSAMRLAVLHEHLTSRNIEGGQPEQIVQHLDELAHAYEEINAMRQKVEDVDPSPEHLEMLERLEEWERGLFSEGDRLAESIIADRTIFTEFEATMIGDRILPFFESFHSPSKQEVHDRVSELEQKSREK